MGSQSIVYIEEKISMDIIKNKTEHAVQSFAAGKTNKIAMLNPDGSNANANQC